MILICVAAIGIISVVSIQQTADRISTQYMNEICEEKSDEMDYFLEQIQQSVNIAAHYMTDEISVVELVEAGVVGAAGTGDSLGNRNYDSEEQAQFDQYLHELVEKARNLLHSISYNSYDAMTYFYRINPEFSKTEPGILYVRQNMSDYQEQTPTDIFSFSSDDMTRVGWYYQTLDRGRPSWLPPYEDKNLGSVVTTFIAPIYKAGTFTGMVGMDVSYESLVEKVDNLNLYRSGYAFLTDEFGKIIYHPNVPAGTLLGELNRELEADEEYVSKNEDSLELVSYSFGGVEKRAAWRTLDNGLRLFVCAPLSEIQETWQQLIFVILIAAAVLLVVFSILVAVIMSRVTNPLNKLAIASAEIEKGNYDVELPEEGRDEVGVLTRSFRHLTEHLKAYVSDLNSKAYKDELTSVKNKAALSIFTEQLNAAEPSARKYAVILFDCNNLKKINDVYGHDKGDIYLQKACSVICDSFPRSPVFRVGGDEFIAILQKDAFEQREELLQQFRQNAEEINRSAEHEWEEANLASGIAVYDSSLDREFADVLRRADEQMYENKKQWKEAHGLPG